MATRAPRILVVSEIPTPYRLPLYAKLAASSAVELEVVFCSRVEPDRPWELDAALETVPHRFLRGISPSIRTRRGTFVYELNPEAVTLVSRMRPDAVVVGGYSVFAEQAAVVTARARQIPYLLHSESTLAARRPQALAMLKQVVVRPMIAGASGGLATGSAAARYLEHYGLANDRIRIVPNTIDVAEHGRAAAAARARAAEIRAERGLPDRYVLFAGRLVENKGILDLLAARRLGGRGMLPLVVAGQGRLEREAQTEPGVRYLGFVQPDELIELYALAEWTVVPSRREPWGVVVNEALACGCPVLATDQVGAAVDLIEDGVNGRVVAAGSPGQLAAALKGPRPSGDPTKGTIERWTHEFAADQFVEGVMLALDGRSPR